MYEQDFEDQIGRHIATDRKPFCGTASMKNSVTLFNEGGDNPTINLLFYGQVNNVILFPFINSNRR